VDALVVRGDGARGAGDLAGDAAGEDADAEVRSPR
jgi:hypothetical protein